jgi:hypothetical protein
MVRKKEKGYLVLDIDLATQTVSAAQQITYNRTWYQVIAVTVEFHNDVPNRIFARYLNSNTDAILSGKTADGKAAGLPGEKIAKILKGNMLVFSGNFGSGAMSATLDTKLTKAEAGKDIATVVNDIISPIIPCLGCGDWTPPEPNPMTWAIAPVGISGTQIIMIATTATDAATPPVEYYFTNKTLTGHDSGWQTSTTYIDTGLTPNTTYTYAVRARDSAPMPNETAASADANATTLP